MLSKVYYPGPGTMVNFDVCPIPPNDGFSLIVYYGPGLITAFYKMNEYIVFLLLKQDYTSLVLGQASSPLLHSKLCH